MLADVKSIQVISGVTTITYRDGTKWTTKGDISLDADYKNTNNIPLRDFCI